MSRIRIKTESDQFQPMRDFVPEQERSKYSERELDAGVRIIEEGGSDTLQLFEISYLPNTVIDVHAHIEDEIIYIVEGEMVAGIRVLGQGSTLFVSGNTLYGFKAGPRGLRMLNFRPRADHSFIPAKLYQRRARLDREEASEGN